MKRLILAAVLAGAWSADRPVPFRVGETLTFDVSWSSFLTAGTATVSLRERRTLSPARAAYHLVAEAKPTGLLNALYHVYYKADALLDTDTLEPIESTMFSEERGRKKTKLTRFLEGGTGIEFETQTDKVVHEAKAVPKYTLDPLSAFYVLRALPFSAGASMVTPLTEGGKTYQLRVTVSAPEPIKTALGTLMAWKLTSTVTEVAAKPGDPGRFVAWITNDVRRLPVRIEFDLAVGSFILALVSAT